MASVTSFEKFLHAPVVDIDCPATEKLAAFILGLVSSDDQLSLAAHVRSCPRCQLAVSFASPKDTAVHPGMWQQKLKRLLAYPLPASNLGFRGAEQSQQFQVEHFSVVVTPMPHTHEGWQLAGRILYDGVGQAGWKVLAMKTGRRSRTITDNDGFFVFEQLLDGHYLLSFSGDRVRIHIRDLTLGVDGITL